MTAIEAVNHTPGCLVVNLSNGLEVVNYTANESTIKEFDRFAAELIDRIGQKIISIVRSESEGIAFAICFFDENCLVIKNTGDIKDRLEKQFSAE